MMMHSMSAPQLEPPLNEIPGYGPARVTYCELPANLRYGSNSINDVSTSSCISSPWKKYEFLRNFFD